jgi:hypothetical protein
MRVTIEPKSINFHVSWKFLRTFNLKRSLRTGPSWAPIVQMVYKAHEALAPAKGEYNRLYTAWQNKLQSLGGDPSAQVLENFRPLRLSREEDWSDWLAWLLEKSETGVLAETLFGSVMDCDAASLKLPRVKREEPSEDQERRADLVVKWKSGKAADIEVKVGDRQFGKTLETAAKLKSQHHFILITEDLLPDWSDIESDHVREAHKGQINVILWSHVVRGLRRCLWEGRESLAWRAWAWTFCGAIEQKLLGLRRPVQQQSEVSQLQMTLAWLDVLRPSGGNHA